MTRPHVPVRVLIPFNAAAKPYGMERAVIELFDALRPNVEPNFLLSHGALRGDLPVLAEVRQRALPHSFFSDTAHWPRIEKPRSPMHAWKLCVALWKGNRDVLRHARQTDAVYLCGINYAFFAVLTFLYCLVARKLIVYHFHDMIGRRSIALYLLRWAVDDFVHSTELSKQTVVAFNPCLLKRRNRVIPLLLKPLDDANAETPAHIESTCQRPVLFVGQVSLHKGIDLLIEAMAGIAADYPDVVLWILGECAPPFQRAFDLLLSDPRLAGRVVCLGYRADVSRLMARAYVYVQPTPPGRFTESFGRGVLEAMACGIPAVCFRSGSLQELVVHRQTGLLCDREDSVGLGECLRQFLDDRELRDMCAANARTRYESVYSSSHIVQAWESLLSRGVKTVGAGLSVPAAQRQA